jgi:UDP-N-acetylglucosamine 2-epimerase (non-hydrolysing)
LGVPCLTLRDNTERPITISEGTNQLVGRTPEGIRVGVQRVLDGRITARKPNLWDGHAGDRIAEALLVPDLSDLRRPTEQ